MRPFAIVLRHTLKRFRPAVLGLLAVLMVSACDFWPRELDTLAESISREVSGKATAWLLGGNLVVIDVEGSPLYQAAPADLEAAATGLAEQAVERSAAPLESIIITFHEGQSSDDPEKMREFLFLVLESRPVLQPPLVFDASGPLQPEELAAAMDRLGEPLTGERRACVRAELEQSASAAGDPETLDPESIELLPAGNWRLLDDFGRRLFLAQALTTQALFDCADE